MNEKKPSSRTSQLSLFLKELHHVHDDDDTQLCLFSFYFAIEIICAFTCHLKLWSVCDKECGVRGPTMIVMDDRILDDRRIASLFIFYMLPSNVM